MARKLFSIFWIYLKECFAYPAASIIWVVADAQTAMILPAVWMAAGSSFFGMTGNDIIGYYLVSMTLAQFITCHLMWDIAWDIKEGFFSGQIIRPVPYFGSQAARNLSWRVAKLALFAPVFVAVSLAYGLSSVPSIELNVTFIAATVLAHTLSYMLAFAMAMTAFWTVEFVSILRLYYLPEQFLSGRLVPLQSLPDWAATIANALPFRWTNDFPVRLALGKVSEHEASVGLIIQVFWIVLSAVLCKVLFVRGTRHYSGVGM
ncbi:MAG TPA: ABC-2 family transporter protein [Fimbriimonadaceae bacterium]|nr:ABC-2 family transporter protein [Fimbriimonadaceae bacterium]